MALTSFPQMKDGLSNSEGSGRKDFEEGSGEVLKEVSGSEDVMTGASNETPGMISPLPISPTQSVGEGFVSDGPESTEMEMDVEEMDLPDAKDETAIPDENGSMLKVGWDDVALTKYIQKIWSKQRNDSVEPFLLSKTCGVNMIID